MNNFAILVITCDKYSSLWKPFFLQFQKYVPRCPYTVYLGSNNKKYHRKGVKSLISKIDSDWSSHVLSILNQIDEEYVFIWLDDFFLTDYLDVQLFQHCLDFLVLNKANHMHISPGVPSDGLCDDPFISFFKKGAPYRVSVSGFWNKEHLKKILLPGESPWLFEIFGSYRSSYFDGYYCPHTLLFSYIQIVERGKIFYQAYQYCIKHGIELDTKRWEIHSFWDSIRSDFFQRVFHIMLRIPWTLRLQIMNFFRKGLVSY